MSEIPQILPNDVVNSLGESTPYPIVTLPHGGPEGELQGLEYQRLVEDIVSTIPGIIDVVQTDKDGREDTVDKCDLIAHHDTLGRVGFQVKSIDYLERRFYYHTLRGLLEAEGIEDSRENRLRWMNEHHLIVVNAGHIKNRKRGITPVTPEQIRARITSRIEEIMAFEDERSVIFEVA